MAFPPARSPGLRGAGAVHRPRGVADQRVRARLGLALRAPKRLAPIDSQHEVAARPSLPREHDLAVGARGRHNRPHKPHRLKAASRVRHRAAHAEYRFHDNLHRLLPVNVLHGGRRPPAQPTSCLCSRNLLATCPKRFSPSKDNRIALTCHFLVLSARVPHLPGPLRARTRSLARIERHSRAQLVFAVRTHCSTTPIG